MIKTIVHGIAFLVSSVQAEAQLIEYYELPESLKEISGLEILNDSTLVALNDGGNKPKLYLLDFKGNVQKKVDIEDVKNRDWEDIAIDEEYIYIGDIGNNLNKRDNLRILKVEIEDVLNKKEVKAEKIKFNYGEQKAFPPASDSMYYDAEGMTIYNDSIWIFTKDRTHPSEGYSHIYKLPTAPGEYTVYRSEKVFIGKSGWWKDGITAVDFYDDLFYILTYDRYMVKRYTENGFENVSSFKFNATSQRESIVVFDKESIFVADEKNPLVGDVKLYKIRPKRD
jgi:hypothetical protein